MKPALCTFIIFFLGLYPPLLSQTKYEKEERINAEHVPVVATSFVNQIGYNKKIKWYREEGLNRISYEAKTKWNRKKHSLEFDEHGNFEDLEIQVKWKHLPKQLKQSIQDYLETNHDSYKVRKVQLQLSGDQASVTAAIQGEDYESLAMRYEIVFVTKTKGERKMIEYLFSAEGAMQRKSIIVFKNTDNLEY